MTAKAAIHLTGRVKAHGAAAAVTLSAARARGGLSNGEPPPVFRAPA